MKTPNSLEGKTLGKYRILEPLGRGGMAQVYRAYHPQLDRYVAVKVLRSDLIEEGEFLARFQREARSVAALRHPNVVQVYDFDIQDDIYYMVMELLEGDTLKAYLQTWRTQGKRLPAQDVVRILLDVLNGLAYAHGEGITHRDIKPANIMLTRKGEAVLTDFGIAQIVGGTQYTVSGALMGTLNYMAPEQGLEGRGDQRSDIYSLGIVLYEMLTGQIPFDADTPLAILMKHVNDPLPLPHTLVPEIPEPLECVVLRALAKRPEDRYPSAEEMARALQQAATDCNLPLPERVQLPRLNPAAPGAVISGMARQNLSGAAFAEDTDAMPPAETTQKRRSTDPFDEMFDNFGEELGEKIENLINERIGSREGQQAIIFAGINLALILAGGNLLALGIGSLTGSWQIYSLGWAFELALLAWGLAGIMGALELIWILVPIGILLGNVPLMAYSAFSDNWGAWSYLWIVELMLVVFVSVGVARIGLDDFDTARRYAREWVRPLQILCALTAVVTALAALFVDFSTLGIW